MNDHDPFGTTTDVVTGDAALAAVRRMDRRIEERLKSAISPKHPAMFGFISAATHWLLVGYYDPKIYGARGGWEIKGLPKDEFDAEAAKVAYEMYFLLRSIPGDSIVPFTIL